MTDEHTGSRLAALLGTLKPKAKQPVSTKVLNTWIAQAEDQLGDEAKGGRLGWLIASSVAIAAVQRAIDADGRQLFLLKGGTLLQHRLNVTARTTKDVDDPFARLSATEALAAESVEPFSDPDEQLPPHVRVTRGKILEDMGGDVVADRGVEAVGERYEAVGTALPVDKQGPPEQVFAEVVEMDDDDFGAAEPGAGGEAWPEGDSGVVRGQEGLEHSFEDGSCLGSGSPDSRHLDEAALVGGLAHQDQEGLEAAVVTMPDLGLPVLGCGPGQGVLDGEVFGTGPGVGAGDVATLGLDGREALSPGSERTEPGLDQAVPSIRGRLAVELGSHVTAL